MVCGKCGNTNLSDARHELQDFYVRMREGTWMKCFKCGWRGKPIEKRDKKPEEGTMPKFANDADRLAWVEKVRATKERKRQAEREAQGLPREPRPSILPAVAKNSGNSQGVSPVSLVTMHVSMNAALLKLQEDAATIQRAMVIIERMQA